MLVSRRVGLLHLKPNEGIGAYNAEKLRPCLGDTGTEMFKIMEGGWGSQQQEEEEEEEKEEEEEEEEEQQPDALPVIPIMCKSCRIIGQQKNADQSFCGPA